jgi:nucleotide-binding universal stress UspA family protein
MHEDTDMTPQLRDPNIQPSMRRYRIVVGVDLSEYSDIVIQHALDQAARHDAPELHFLTVDEKSPPTSEDLKAALWARVHPTLEKFNERGTNWRARLHVRHGKPSEEISELAAEVRGDLIVIGQFGVQKSHDNLPNRVLQAAGCPTLVVGDAAGSSPRCAICVEVRQASDGEHWFCEPHTHSNRRLEQTCSPMTTWTAGMLMCA